MRLRPFFSYYGSKHRIARRYPSPVTGRIVEPFAGSAAYASCHPRCDVLLVEANPKVAGVWDYLIHATGAEIRRIPLLGPEEGVDALPDRLPQEASWLVGFWLAKGRGAPFLRPSAWRKAKFGMPEYDGSFWGEVVRLRIALQVERIRHWKVRCADYTSAPNDSADWFIDPPYHGRAGRAYNAFGSHKLDYAALSVWCGERSGQVIVCEAEGADWLPFSPFLSTISMNGPLRSAVSREVVWHRSDVPPLQGTLFDSAILVSARAGEG